MWKYILLLIIGAIASLLVGVADISWQTLTSEQLQILVQSRIPRLIAVLITGATMSIAGLIMQQLSQNKFAAPSTSGTIEAASLGLLVAMVFVGATAIWAKVAIAFVFALGGAWLFMTMLDRVVYKDALFIPLLGIMFGRVISAMTTFIAYKYDLVQRLNAWIYGDFSGVLKGRYELLYLGVVVIIVTYLYAHKLTIVGFGESFAHSLGLNYQAVKRLGLTLVAISTATVVLTVGEISFIGLIIPNLVTMWRGDNIRANLPYVAIIGALFVLACDIVGRLIIYPYEVSVSLVIGVIGSILFLTFLVRRKQHGY